MQQNGTSKLPGACQFTSLQLHQPPSQWHRSIPQEHLKPLASACATGGDIATGARSPHYHSYQSAVSITIHVLLLNPVHCLPRHQIYTGTDPRVDVPPGFGNATAWGGTRNRQRRRNRGSGNPATEPRADGRESESRAVPAWGGVGGGVGGKGLLRLSTGCLRTSAGTRSPRRRSADPAWASRDRCEDTAQGSARSFVTPRRARH
ncbi:hypothetical protein AAFF_G00258850 [Aldrovandia affinis]|uniref:Uncharacterized protein n=1 Tax=Aldrovandia affinis TaxID=143900 RepID=A0AAD7SVA2_9TELE|nr:hypothetical protein AAFF_G00258850 [Aldrovandia affinis]